MMARKLQKSRSVLCSRKIGKCLFFILVMLFLNEARPCLSAEDKPDPDKIFSEVLFRYGRCKRYEDKGMAVMVSDARGQGVTQKDEFHIEFVKGELLSIRFGAPPVQRELEITEGLAVERLFGTATKLPEASKKQLLHDFASNCQFLSITVPLFLIRSLDSKEELFFPSTGWKYTDFDDQHVRQYRIMHKSDRCIVKLAVSKESFIVEKVVFKFDARENKEIELRFNPRQFQTEKDQTPIP